MEVKEKKYRGRKKFIIWLPLAESSLSGFLTGILSALKDLSKLPYTSTQGFSWLYGTTFATGKLFTALSNIRKIREEDPGCRYLSEEEQKRFEEQSQKIKNLLDKIHSELQAMVQTTPERIQEAFPEVIATTKAEISEPEAEISEPEAPTSPEEII